MWEAIIGSPISPEQVVLCMAALKIAREAGQHDPDNMIDAAGYMSLVEEVRQWRRGDTSLNQGPPRLMDGTIDTTKHKTFAQMAAQSAREEDSDRLL